MLYTDVIRRTLREAVQVMKEEGVDKSGTQRDSSNKVCLTFKGNVSMTTVTYETWAGEKKKKMKKTTTWPQVSSDDRKV